MYTNAVASYESKLDRAMVVTRCCSCKKYKDGLGGWTQIIEIPKNVVFSDGICVPCIRLLYPVEMAERIVARLKAQELTDGITF